MLPAVEEQRGDADDGKTGRGSSFEWFSDPAHGHRATPPTNVMIALILFNFLRLEVVR